MNSLVHTPGCGNSPISIVVSDCSASPFCIEGWIIVEGAFQIHVGVLKAYPDGKAVVR